MDNAAQLAHRDAPTHAVSRHYLVVSAATIIAAYLGWDDFEANFILSGIATLTILVTSLLLVHKFRRQRAEKLLACIVLVLINIATCTHQTNRLEHRIEPVIAALAQYQTQHGDYPQRLDALMPRYLAAIPRCQQSRLRYAQLNNSRYVLYCVTYGFHKHTYDSSTRQWKGED